MYGKNTYEYEKRISAFGWKTLTVDGHNIPEIADAYKEAFKAAEKPVMIIAKTLKGKGVKLFEDKNGWHGKALSKEQAEKAIMELGEVDKGISGKISDPEAVKPTGQKMDFEKIEVKDEDISTRKAYGMALVNYFQNFLQWWCLMLKSVIPHFLKFLRKRYHRGFLKCILRSKTWRELRWDYH